MALPLAPAPAAARWHRRKEARPHEIVAAALAEFGERGYAATRLDDVARRAGVTKGTLYLYFPNKEELFKAVIRDTLVPALNRIGEAPAAPTVAATIEQMVAAFQALAGSPIAAIPKIVIGESGNFPEITRFYLDEVISRGLDVIRTILGRGVDSGEFRAIDTEHAAYCAMAPLLLALLWTHSFGPVADRPLDVAALCRAHLDLLLNGLKPREAAP
jgi:AcrR family transcriptional regulator